MLTKSTDSMNSKLIVIFLQARFKIDSLIDFIKLNQQLQSSSFYFSVPPERTSFRSYTAVLYSEPRMRIFIQVSRIHACLII